MVRLFDNTLRDGGNVVGHGFPIALTESIVQALLSCGIADIECGNCKGLGAYDKLGATQAPSDEEYFSALQPYLPQGRIGMFLLAKLADRELVRRAADAGLHFLRVGANAGDGAGSVQAVSLVKEAGLTCRYSLMKGYILSPAALAQEARMLQDAGVDPHHHHGLRRYDVPRAGGGLRQGAQGRRHHPRRLPRPQQPRPFAGERPRGGRRRCRRDRLWPAGHGPLRGQLRDRAGRRHAAARGYLPDVDLYGLLHYLDETLIPAMRDYDYHVAVNPTELMLGLTGCHSALLPLFQKVAREEGVSLLRLIADVSAIDRKSPSEALLRETAQKLK